MSYVLDGTAIRNPRVIRVTNDTQVAQNRTLDGSVSRDYFGSNKRVWVLNYENVTPSDFNTINSIYESYLSTGTTKTWEITETNYTISETNVHVDLQIRDFITGGDTYISNFDLVLTEE